MNAVRLFASASLIAFAWPFAGAAAEPIAPAPDFGRDVRDLFAAKCAVCHGPGLEKPKGRFGYVLDLPRMAGNPEMVIPGRPGESELWELVQRGEMPPAESPAGGLRAEQKALIEKWIAAGAPDARPVVPEFRPTSRPVPPAPPTEAPSAAAPTTAAAPDRILGWVGKFHLLMLHFPIALVFAAGVAEARAIRRRDPTPSEAVRFCLWLAALAALPTAVLGWLFAAAGNGVGSPRLLTAHRALGTAAAAWLLIAAVCCERDARRGARSRHVRPLLMIGILATSLAAHLGGLLAHGEDYFSY